ncbi:hypothetical protein nbrc107696_15720 [Gordonia spumicola]|uniref:Uncharacterized protein n=1 Tax=Gordonia spumicola TaxID=589161 RepID=A0A7I9V6U9_9ACTN|nr:hypothetical protein [Gordonia spumicola]GEE01126.1 hypothetical protein nbrc107696_15720 [Gordonia spumicola]
MTVPARTVEHQPGRRALTVERAAEDVSEFERIVPHSDVDTACTRMRMHPRTLIRRYRLLGRAVYPGLWYAEHQRRRIAADVATITPATVDELLDFAEVIR